jgi:uncharacterized membrane protein
MAPVPLVSAAPTSAPAEPARARTARLCASVLLVALIVLGVAWELWLAPLRPGGSWLVLKVLPLAAFSFAVFAGRRRGYQALSLAVWAYFMEGMVRATSDRWPSAGYAWAEAALALALFAAVVVYVRAGGGSAASGAAR